MSERNWSSCMGAKLGVGMRTLLRAHAAFLAFHEMRGVPAYSWETAE